MALRLKTLCDLPESCYVDLTEEQKTTLIACASLEAFNKPIDKRITSSETYKTLLRTLHHSPELNNKAYSRWMLAFIASQIQTVKQAVLWAYTIERVRDKLDKIDTYPINVDDVFSQLPPGKIPNDEGYDLAYYATSDERGNTQLENMDNWRFENLEEKEWEGGAQPA